MRASIAMKLKRGEIKAEDVIRLMRVDDVLGFYIVKRGDTLWRIAKKEAYGNPMMWPLLYRYNMSRLKHPDLIRPGNILIIVKDVSKDEARDALRKARLRGDWKKWSDSDRKAWLEDWLNRRTKTDGVEKGAYLKPPFYLTDC